MASVKTIRRTLKLKLQRFRPMTFAKRLWDVLFWEQKANYVRQQQFIYF